MVWAQLVIAGVAGGAVTALSGMGLILTYRSTGVFNFGHGAIATFVAYTLWQMRVGWGWPLWLSVVLSVLVAGPLLGVILEWAVFGPMQRAGASTSEKLVATLGVFVLLVAICFVVWSG